MIRLIGLDHRFPGEHPSAGPAHRLGQKLESPLSRPVIRRI